MKQRAVRYILALAVLLCALCYSAPAASAATAEELLQWMPLEDCDYRYSAGNGLADASVFYSHALLFQDSNILSPELAKASVALSVTAYDPEEVSRLLVDMDFIPGDNSSDYAWCDESLTFLDCDYAAFTIATKHLIHPITNEEYILYCVPIRGTPPNLEWFSDFNVGAGAEHLGFQRASEDIYERLLRCFQTDGIEDPSHRILWLTGHSRGAACANLLAGWFSDKGYEYVSKDNLFAYTFACPTVSKKANTSLDNIFNFNNPGDLVPMLPLPEWGFSRYGKTLVMDTSGRFFDNFNQQFSYVTGSDYAGEVDGDVYRALLSEISRSEDFQLILDLVSLILSKADEDVLQQIILKHIPTSPEALLDMIPQLYETNGPWAWVDLLVGRDMQNKELIQWAGEAFKETHGMSESDFAEYLEDHSSMVDSLQSISGVTITHPSSFQLAQSTLEMDCQNLLRFGSCVDAALQLLGGGNGTTLDKVLHGHGSPTYHTWINALYYGYGGWRGNTSITSFSLDERQFSIGASCFDGCTGLTELTIPDHIRSIGAFTFAQCSSLRSAAIPADLRFPPKAFSRTSNVEELHYTKGVTGVMEDRGKTAIYGDNSHMDALAYESRDTLNRIVFEEGVTHVGTYLCYTNNFNFNRPALKSVVFPSTLKSIGSFAFHLCSELTINELPEGLQTVDESAFKWCGKLRIDKWPSTLTTIGDYAFALCDGLKTHPVTVSAFPEGCFYGCSNLISITIPNHITTVGVKAFSECTEVRSVTMPSDFQYPDGKAFDNVRNVETIHYTKGITDMVPDVPQYATNIEYVSCASIRNVIFDEGITHTRKNLLRCGHYSPSDDVHPVMTVTLPSTLQSVGESAFMGRRNMIIQEWPKALRFVGPWAFYDCDLLTEIPPTVTGFQERSFSNCDGLTSITIPDTVTCVGVNAFSECMGVRTVTLPADFTYYGTYTYHGEEYYGYNCFDGTTNVETVHYTKGATGIMPDRHDPESSTVYSTLETNSISHIRNMTFEEGITHIAADLFYTEAGTGETGLETMILPSTLESVGGRAFYRCTNLESLTFSGNAPAIGNNTFSGVTTIVYYPQYNTTWTDDVLQNYGGNLSWTPLICNGEHMEFFIEASDPTCVDPGYRNATICAACGDVLSAQEIIPATGRHTYETPVFTWSEDFSCIASFSCRYCEVVIADNCEVTIQTIPGEGEDAIRTVYRATVFLDGISYTDTKTVDHSQQEHNHQPERQWRYDNDHHWKQCIVCKEKLEVAAHSPDPAAPENTNRKCTVCGFVIRVPLGLERFADPIEDPNSTFWATGYYAKIMELFGIPLK